LCYLIEVFGGCFGVLRLSADVVLKDIA